MALSFSRLVLTRQQSMLQSLPLCASTQSVRWRVRKRKLWLEEDERKTTWMEPLFEYRREKEAAAGQEKEPAMLHVVRRLYGMKGRPWWEKKIIEKLGLDGYRKEPVIHKNTPEINKLLRDVKHLVSIQPLTFPDGFPDDPRDYPHTVITSRGELRVTRTLRPAGEPEWDETPQPASEQDKWTLKQQTIAKEMRRTMESYSIHEDYVDTAYTYTRNQDGKEYRYNERFNTNSSRKE